MGSEGFVLASADDNAVEILGYSDEGKFDPNNIPDCMKFLMECYARQISSLSETSAAPQKTIARTQSTEVIQPLLGNLKWDQMPPNNLKCPLTVGGSSNSQYNGGRAATGCVTTALAQVMYYHKHPKQGYGSIEFDVTEGVGKAKWSVDLYNDAYHWESMATHKDYFAKSGSSYNLSNQGVNDVATLMRDLGMALRTSYGPASGSVRTRLIPAIINYFDYNAESIELVEMKKIG
ncbi:MAG: C10 family peptidase [Bacteroidales bacterium]|nr:C10 family peptidase [Candidatus Physcousia equi]